MAENDNKVVPFKKAAEPLNGIEGHDAITYGTQPLRDPEKYKLNSDGSNAAETPEKETEFWSPWEVYEPTHRR